MIRYALKCKKGHQFEAWFKSSVDYDSQAKRGLVTCASCGSTEVEKALMAPRVAKRGSKAPGSMTVAQTPEIDDKRLAIQKEMASLMRRLRTEVEKNADYVGTQFAEEARKIHHEESPARGIYGEATAEEVTSLKEEGVEFYPLPRLPEDQN